MNAGTKIFLALVGLLVIVLVVYYGVLTDDVDPISLNDRPGESSTATEEPEAAEPSPAPRAQERERERPRPTPRSIPVDDVQERDPSRFLSESLEEALGRGDRDVADRPDVQPVDDDAERPRQDPLPMRVPQPAPDVIGPPLPGDLPSRDPGKGEPGPLEAVEPTPDEPEPSEQPRETPVEPVEYTEYTVQPGDTLTSIAQEWFGNANKWDLIARANPFIDPNRLRVGQTLRLPPKEAERDPAEGRPGETIYTVRPGDTLVTIARAYYNDSGLWRIIYNANRETIGENPHRLRVGMELVIPPAPARAEDD